MSLAHLAMGSRDVVATADFLCAALGWERIPSPANAPVDVAWIDLSPQRDRSHQIHFIHVPDFQASPFEREFGRHMAVFHAGHDMQSARQRIRELGGEVLEAIRPTPFDRFFFREPVNGYVFEVIHREAWAEE